MYDRGTEMIHHRFAEQTAEQWKLRQCRREKEAGSKHQVLRYSHDNWKCYRCFTINTDSFDSQRDSLISTY